MRSLPRGRRWSLARRTARIALATAALAAGSFPALPVHAQPAQAPSAGLTAVPGLKVGHYTIPGGRPAAP